MHLYRFVDTGCQGPLSDSSIFSESAEPADTGMQTADSFSSVSFLSFPYSFGVLNVICFYPDTFIELQRCLQDVFGVSLDWHRTGLRC